MFKVLRQRGIHVEIILIVLLLTASFVLRFVNLGYSDYISDEPGTFFYRGGKKDPGMSMWEFTLSQRKGPLQLLVGYIPYTLNGNSYGNEFAQRLPFALFSFCAVYVFYAFVKKLSGNYLIAFFSAFLFSVNGLIVAYGRIAQYQNLNFFLSFAALYFYVDLWKKPENVVKSSLMGTILLCLSLYAHWFAAFILIPIAFFYGSFLLNRNYTLRYKLGVTLLNLIIGAGILAPFYIPYFQYMQTHPEFNTDYADKILGFTNPFLKHGDAAQFNLYNPFLTLYLYTIGGLVGAVYLLKKKIYMPVVWFLLVLVLFKVAVSYSGLHFYNYFYPLVILVSYGFYFLIKHLSRYFALIVGLIFLFLFIQSYVIYVDHKKEYPFEQEKILFLTTPKYGDENNFRHKSGFTHSRKWAEINKWVNDQNKLSNEKFGYYTNEYPQIAKYYMDTEFKSDADFYAIGIKRPQTFATDYSFPQIKNKHTVHEIENEEGETVVKIYRVAGSRDKKN